MAPTERRTQNVTLPNDWTPRDYQIVPFSKLDSGCKRVITVWPRRAGKDSAGLNYIAKAAFTRVGTYWHVMPLQSQARKAVWQAVDMHGRRIIDQAFPKILRKRTLEDQMLIEFINGSFFQLVGGDQFDSLVGTNPIGIVFSETALMSPNTWHYISPILAQNGGWIWFNGTPREENWYHDLFTHNEHNPNWHVELKTVLDLKHIPLSVIEEERASGMPESKIQQEYYCSWKASNIGSLYGPIIAALKANNRIGSIPYDPRFPVETSWDIGKRDATSVWFAQRIGREIRFIDYHEEAGKGLPYHAKIVNAKPYSYSRHIGPHDLNVTEWGSDTTRIELARNHGINFIVAPKLSHEEGQAAVRAVLPVALFDAVACKQGIAALAHSHRKYDEEKKILIQEPVHDWSSHAEAAMRYYAVTPAHLGITPDWARGLNRHDGMPPQGSETWRRLIGDGQFATGGDQYPWRSPGPPEANVRAFGEYDPLAHFRN